MVRSRFAFTFIELIFAIVIIGIAVISLPVMNGVISKGIENNIVQEAIFAAATELNEAVTAYWDENSLEAGAANSLSRVIDSGDCINDANLSTYRQRPGHINQLYHRRCLDSNTTPVSNSNTNANVMALNDMAKTDADVFLNNTASPTGYKDTYTSTVTVTQNPVFAGANNLNMKIIQVTIKNSNNDVVTSLTTYSANIGEIDYYKRNY